jgi:hypothetical protein
VQRVGIVALLQAGCRIEGDVVVDELAEVGVAGRDARVVAVTGLVGRVHHPLGDGARRRPIDHERVELAEQPAEAPLVEP